MKVNWRKMGIEALGFIHCLHLKSIDNKQQVFTDEEMKDITGLDTGKSPIYNDMDLPTVRGIGTHKIHD